MRNKTFVMNRGSVLLFSLGVLALLSLLGTALVLISRQENRSSEQYLDETRAEFTAESGVETAIAKVLGLNCPLTDISDQAKFLPDSLTVPLRYVRQSSFGNIDTDGNGLKDAAGVISHTYMRDGDFFKLRVMSTQSKLNINDSNSPLNIDTDPFEDQRLPNRVYNDLPKHLRHPLDADHPDEGFDRDWIYPGQPEYRREDAIEDGKPYPKAPGRLWGIVKELADILFQDSAPGIGQNVANALFKARKATRIDRFDRYDEMRRALVPQILNQEQYQLLESFLVLDSWQDENVLKPSFQWRLQTPNFVQNRERRFAPEVRHPCHFSGDFETPIPVGMYWPNILMPPCKRPGYPDTQYYVITRNEAVDEDGVVNIGYTFGPGGRQNVIGETLGAVTHDFNGDGSIQLPPEDQPLGYSESYRHDRDIYFFSDMQTKYFETERRSPIDVNNAPIELLEALIRQVRGWYLKEAPATGEGEDPRARAEDWNQHNLIDPLYGLIPAPNEGSSMHPQTVGFPWLCVSRLAHMFVGQPFGPAYPDFGHGLVSNGTSFADVTQYYYYDSYAKDYIHWNTAQNGYRIEYGRKSHRFGELMETKSFRETLRSNPNTTAAKELSKAIYDRIHPTGGPKKPFLTWEEFETWLLDLADEDGVNELSPLSGDFDIYMAHAIIANFNPNSRLNDFNPNKDFHLFVDKSKLSEFSAEFCFHPMGYFQIQSYGAVRDASQSGLAASTQFNVTAKIMDVLRVSSQKDFMRGYDPQLSATDQFFGEATGFPTHGANGSFNGVSLQSYPEPDCPAENFIASSGFDGYLMLATLQGNPDSYFDDGGPNNQFVVDFAGTLDARRGRNAAIAPDGGDLTWKTHQRHSRLYKVAANGWGPSDPGFQVPTNHPGVRRLTRSTSELADPSSYLDAPGNLFPDGALSDVGRALKYPSAGNIGDEAVLGKRGSVGFWVKPNFDPSHSNRIRKLFGGGQEAGTNLIAADEGTTANNNSRDNRDFRREFGLYYFSRGGQRVICDSEAEDIDPAFPGLKPFDDNINLGYDPQVWDHDGRWLPTRSFFLVAGRTKIRTSSISSYKRLYGTSSTTSNQSWRWWRSPGEAAKTRKQISTGGWEQNFESHQWSHVAFSWDWWGLSGDGYATTPKIGPSRYFHVSINGKTVEQLRDQVPPITANPTGTQRNLDYFGTESYPFQDGILLDTTGAPNFVRFGESSSTLFKNEVADCTYDDIVCSKSALGDTTLLAEYGYGRYDAKNDVAYTSPLFPLFEIGENNSLTLRDILWTAYWPKGADNNLPANHPRFNSNRNSMNSDLYDAVRSTRKEERDYPSDPMSPLNGGTWTEDWIPFSIDIINPETGKWHYAEELNLPKERMPNFAGGSWDADWQSNPLRWTKNQNNQLRFRVHFNIEEGQTLYCSPIFDDITFIFKMNRPKILNWEND